ncbi:MAG: SurA N-terminal domain-containing protein [Steroidobacteraceae bacterium]
MLQAIHDNLKGVFAMIILGVLAVVFVFWGVEFVSVGGVTSTQGIAVNGEDVDVEPVRREYQEQVARYQSAFPGQDLPEEILTDLREESLRRAVTRELVRQRTSDLRLRASAAEVLESIRSIPAFQVAGQFSRDAYFAALSSANLKAAAFEAEQREALAAQHLERGVAGSAFVLPSELERRVALLQEQREVAWVVLPRGSFRPAPGQVDESALMAWYEDNRERYRTEEQVDISFVELSLDALSAAAEVDEAALRGYYEENLERFVSAERRRVSHILIAAGEGAREAAQKAYERATAGEDFAALARELSADPGSASAGGDLGWQDQATFVGPFGDAAWAQAPGVVGEPVETEFGWHVIKVLEVEPGETKGFDEVRAELEGEYRLAETERRYGELQDELETLAFESGGDLARVAEPLGLTPRGLQGITRAGHPALGDAGTAARLFTAEAIAGTEVVAIEPAPGRVLAVRVTTHRPAADRPLEEVRERALAAYLDQEAAQAALARAEELAVSLRGGGEWAALSRPWVPRDAVEPTSVTARMITRDEAAVPPTVTEAAFAAAAPSAGATYGVTTLGTGDAVVWRLGGVLPGSLSGLPPQLREQSRQEARQRAAFADMATYMAGLREEAEVEVNPQLFQ